MIFMAVTSAFSAQLIAVSSIFTYDIYQAYIEPSAKGKKLVWISHVSCIVYSIIMAGFATGLYYAGVGMGYLYLLMGVIISSAVFPGAMTLLWKGQNWIAAAASPPLGLAVSLIAWLVTAQKQYGVLTVTTTGDNYPMLAGNVAALLSPLVFVPFFTYVFGPQNYDYESMRAIRKVDDSEVAVAAHVDLELVPGETGPSQEQTEEEMRKLNKAAFYSRTLTIFMAFAMLILWPIPMYGTSYVFSKKFFTGWVVVGILWLFCTLFGVVIFPLYEGRESIVRVVRMMSLDIMGKKPMLHEGRKAHESGVATPAEQVEEKGKELETS
jgi:Na+/proline symporter